MALGGESWEHGVGREQVQQQKALRRGHRRRGSQVVEVGLTLIPFFAIVFLTVDVALATFVGATLQHAAREGVRFAVTGRCLDRSGAVQPVGQCPAGGMFQDESIKTVVQHNALGVLSGSAGASKIKIRYYTPDTLTETTSNAGGNLVEISVEGFSWRPLAPLLRSGSAVPISARASDKMEPSVGGVPPRRS